jgi:uncharacterized protein (DUF4415 family)
MTKKPAMLSESLLSHRPRKGEARPQTETQAATATSSAKASREALPNEAPTSASAGRRRRRRSEKTQQLNLRVSEETLEQFTELADSKRMIFGDLLAELLKEYKKDS